MHLPRLCRCCLPPTEDRSMCKPQRGTFFPELKQGESNISPVSTCAHTCMFANNIMCHEITAPWGQIQLPGFLAHMSSMHVWAPFSMKRPSYSESCTLEMCTFLGGQHRGLLQVALCNHCVRTTMGSNSGSGYPGDPGGSAKPSLARRLEPPYMHQSTTSGTAHGTAKFCRCSFKLLQQQQQHWGVHHATLGIPPPPIYIYI